MGWLKKIFFGAEKTMPTSITDANFHQEVLSHRGPILIDVWGPGCQPCDKLAPTIVELADQYAGKVKVCELNASENPKSASRMGVRGTPTIVAYRYGKEVGRAVGWKPKSYFEQMIDTHFAVDFQQASQGVSAAVEAEAGLEQPKGAGKPKAEKGGKKK